MMKLAIVAGAIALAIAGMGVVAAQTSGPGDVEATQQAAFDAATRTAFDAQATVRAANRAVAQATQSAGATKQAEDALATREADAARATATMSAIQTMQAIPTATATGTPSPVPTATETPMPTPTKRVVARSTEGSGGVKMGDVLPYVGIAILATIAIVIVAIRALLMWWARNAAKEGQR